MLELVSVLGGLGVAALSQWLAARDRTADRRERATERAHRYLEPAAHLLAVHLRPDSINMSATAEGVVETYESLQAMFDEAAKQLATLQVVSDGDVSETARKLSVEIHNSLIQVRHGLSDRASGLPNECDTWKTAQKHKEEAVVLLDSLGAALRAQPAKRRYRLGR